MELVGECSGWIRRHAVLSDDFVYIRWMYSTLDCATFTNFLPFIMALKHHQVDEVVKTGQHILLASGKMTQTSMKVIGIHVFSEELIDIMIVPDFHWIDLSIYPSIYVCPSIYLIM